MHDYNIRYIFDYQLSESANSISKCLSRCTNKRKLNHKIVVVLTGEMKEWMATNKPL